MKKSWSSLKEKTTQQWF